MTLPFPRMSKVATQRVETGGAPRCSHPGGPPRRAQRRPRVERKPSLKFLGTDDQRMARTGANRARTVFLCVVSLSLSLFLVCTYLRTFSLWEKRERDARFLSCVFDRPTPSCYVSYFRFLCTQICLLAFVRRQREAVSTSPCPGKTSLARMGTRRPSKGRGRPSPSSRKWRTVAPEPATFAPSNYRNRNKKSGRATTAFVITLEKYVFFHLLPRQ